VVSGGARLEPGSANVCVSALHVYILNLTNLTHADSVLSDRQLGDIVASDAATA